MYRRLILMHYFLVVMISAAPILGKRKSYKSIAVLNGNSDEEM